MKNSWKFSNLYDAYRFLLTHPYYEDILTGISWFKECLDIDVVKVNPKNNTISKDKSLNTQTWVWIETGHPYRDATTSPTSPPLCNMHDHKLDAGGPSIDMAIINLANRLYYHYGDGKNFNMDDYE